MSSDTEVAGECAYLMDPKPADAIQTRHQQQGRPVARRLIVSPIEMRGISRHRVVHAQAPLDRYDIRGALEGLRVGFAGGARPADGAEEILQSRR